ncbi:hypothetical protein [Bacteroides sp. MSB163]
MPLRLPPPPSGYKPEYLDLNGDGKPDMRIVIEYPKERIYQLE